MGSTRTLTYSDRPAVIDETARRGSSTTTATCQLTPALAEEWEHLADRTAAAPFLRPRWFELWLEAFASSNALTVYCARRDGELVGVLPLLGRRGLRSPTNAHTPFFDPLAVDADAAATLADGLIATRPRRVVIDLCRPESSETASLLDRVAHAGYRTETEVLRRLPYIDVSRTWEEYQAHLGGHLRSDLRRQRRRLEGEGDVTLDVSDGSKGLDALLDECLHIEASGWKGRQGTAMASQPHTRRFYEQVAHWLAERGWLELCILRLDGRAVAFDYNVNAHGVYYGFKSGFDEEFRRFGPGKLLTIEVVAMVFARALHRYDFLGDADDYKLRWCDETEARVRTMLFADSVAGGAERLAFRYGVPVAKRVRRAVTRHGSRRPA